MESPFLKKILAMGINPISVSMTAEMVEFVNTSGLKIEPEDIPEYIHMIRQAKDSQQKCQQCTGIQQCQSDAEGMLYVLEMGPTGKVSPSYRLCAYAARERQNRRISRLLASSRLPDHFKNKSFDNFNRLGNQEAYMAAQRVANDDGGKGLLLYGGTGTGKTHLAAAIVNARLARGSQAVFVTVPELLSDIRDTIGRNEDSSELLDIVKDVDLLVLDDMGTERMTAWVCEQLFSVINARLMRKKQTVVTTNYTPSELINRMAVRDRSGNIEDALPGKRIVSRLSEMCQRVELRGKDQRLGGA